MEPEIIDIVSGSTSIAQAMVNVALKVVIIYLENSEPLNTEKSNSYNSIVCLNCCHCSIFRLHHR